jgi:dTDP-4-dehydrorhamnose reductase
MATDLYFSGIMNKQVIAVSGKNGQLGWELQRLSSKYPQYEFVFCDRAELDIINQNGVTEFFQKYHPAFFINTAAYTAVDKAEADQENAFKANAEAVGFIASLCKTYNSTFITFSTDYVFNGEGTKPYAEDQSTDPINYYGYTKEAGEKLALANWEKTIIIRTSWVYSSHGHNFVKTMLRLMKERSDLNVVKDQIGSPTYAKDLAEVVMQIIEQEANNYGIYHYSNEGVISWFDFAAEIGRLSKSGCIVHPIPTSQFPTPAKRPRYSVLAKSRIQEDYNVQLKDWQSSLDECLEELIIEKQ